jgi:hypothetical protein
MANFSLNFEFWDNLYRYMSVQKLYEVSKILPRCYKVFLTFHFLQEKAESWVVKKGLIQDIDKYYS